MTKKRAKTTVKTQAVKTTNRQLHSDVYDALLAKILDGSLKPGLRLNEEVLSNSFGVSRTPLREAFLRLAQNGFVFRSERRGYFVSPLTHEEAKEAYQILCGLEILALNLSGSLASLTIEELKKINRSLQRSRLQATKACHYDELFHKQLLSYCNNKRLLGLIDHHWRVTSRYDRVYMSDPKLVDASVGHHEHIIKQLQPYQADKLVKALEANWRFSSDVFTLKLDHSDTKAAKR
jgi:DNA-binding GntR family transcriptional regulator